MNDRQSSKSTLTSLDPSDDEKRNKEAAMSLDSDVKSNILTPKGMRVSKHKQICTAYSNLLESGKFADLELVCRNKKFGVHRVILASQSSVFAAQLYGRLKESQEDVIEVSDEYDPDIFMTFLRFLYTGEISLHMNNIKGLLTLADFYRVPALHRACFCFLDEQDFDMATLMGMIKTWSTGGAAIQGYLMSRYCDLVPSFSEFVKAKEFLTMNENVLIELLKLDQLCLEESEVLQAVISWGKNQIKTGNSNSTTTPPLKEVIATCMRYVRFELIDTKFIVKDVIPQNLISPDRFVEIMQRKYSDECPAPRRSASFLAFDDKKQGVFYFIGTSGLKTSWTNPCKAGWMTVQLSSSGGASRHCICDRKWGTGAVENSYGSSPTWISFDLKDYQVVPRSYYVHQDQDHFLRNWKFEVSNDNVRWIVLSNHTNDATITNDNRFGHFKVQCGRPYRYFKIHVTGPSHKGQPSFDLTQVELFGRVIPPKKKTRE
mmetsp:Transcript_10843/g.15126  ORF Transcript_10843/g.15126 Transcript_10843/m.15126 type:complete len:488 (-) Transcript_10843:133-1596(-)